MDFGFRRRTRQKLFCEGTTVPMTRHQKQVHFDRVMARSAARRKKNCMTPITPAFERVFRALLFGFHNCDTGLCYPAYETIANKAKVSPSTVGRAIKVLEEHGGLTWDHRLAKHKVAGSNLTRRSSNSYRFSQLSSDRQSAGGTSPSISKGTYNYQITGNRLIDSAVRQRATETAARRYQDDAYDERVRVVETNWTKDQLEVARAKAKERKAARDLASVYSRPIR